MIYEFRKNFVGPTLPKCMEISENSFQPVHSTVN